MTQRSQIAIGIVALVVVGLFLWPIFAQGELWLLPVLALTLAAGALLVIVATRRGGGWARYALLGILPGFVIGGVGLGLFVRLTNTGVDGWEDLAAIAAGIFGSFLGAIAGAVVGGLYGWWISRTPSPRR
jgi:hypothetical protein